MARSAEYFNINRKKMGVKEVKEVETPAIETSDPKKSDYYNFHINSNKVNKHDFLSEELLVPHANNTDAQRLNLWSNHAAQFVHLVKPEFPKVFTNFEDQIGEYSIAYKRAKQTCKIIAKIVKNEYNYDLIVQYIDGEYDILHFNKARNITEDYGYALNDCVSDKEVGDTIKKDEFIYKSDNYDDDGNFSYGTNLKTVWLSWKNLTYEDGIVISESGAEKLKSYKVEKTIFTINGNDILLNLYGDDKHYKSLPKIGEEIKSKILIASRKRDKRTILYDLQLGKIKDIDPVNDDIIYTGGGKVVDIDIFSNMSLEEIRKKTDIFSTELLEIFENNYAYWLEMAKELEKIIPCKQLSDKEKDAERAEFGHVCRHPIDRDKNKNKYSDELAYYWKLSHEFIDDKIQWRYDGKVFNNFKIQFTILKENPLTVGSKLSGRYGNKGVVSKIIPDNEMPITEDGVRAEIIMNPLGVFNRLNISQLQEQYLNFMADHVLKEIKETQDYSEKAKIYFEFLKMVNKEECDFFEQKYLMMNRAEKQDFIDDIEDYGIYIHQPPFFGNTTEDQFKEIFKKHPEWCSEYKFIGIEKPMTMGDNYFIRLKHEPSNKSSMRSATNLNVKGLPAKSALKKEKKVLYSSTPIRLGEMEVSNLCISKRPDIVEKLLKTYSTNEELREETITQLLSPGVDANGNKRNNLNMNIDVDLSNKSISREILEKYLNLLGCSIVDSVETGEDEEGNI